ncbi:hypothetical protein OHA40_26610 [Nocardia sp. NBC_00508]|uniref:hypothetical protein n=1 Tax=Nocardia sp. NBC_00508 TaxID=2975992 RepID=UPI002E819557|nr:hypothetical protein [Nocardia sp. NBC_00508]WUD65184.1 hypothetical protein OHA40_26610 [Nocardia sp. NBC_00508]
MLRKVVHSGRGRQVVVMDSLSQATEADRNHVIVAASNGGAASGTAARRLSLGCVVLNDAGIGKDGAGVAGITALDEVGIPAVAVSHMSAEISNGMDTWDNGVVSFVNETAQNAGFRIGERVSDAVLRFLETSPEPTP